MAQRPGLSRDQAIAELEVTLTIHEKLALGAARLKEQLGHLPQYAELAAMGSDPEKYWERLAASRFNTWRLPPFHDSSTPENSDG